MTINRLAQSDGLHIADKCPPGMPRGDTPADKVARLRFWVEYGNDHLRQIGRNDCLWVIRNGELRLETIA
jgi:hypothetical protein